MATGVRRDSEGPGCPGQFAPWQFGRTGDKKPDGIPRALVRASDDETKGSHMMIGAVIAGLLIVSLFFEMVASSPKPVEKHHTDIPAVK